MSNEKEAQEEAEKPEGPEVLGTAKLTDGEQVNVIAFLSVIPEDRRIDIALTERGSVVVRDVSPSSDGETITNQMHLTRKSYTYLLYALHLADAYFGFKSGETIPEMDMESVDVRFAGKGDLFDMLGIK